jgi:hypothetical protein
MALWLFGSIGAAMLESGYIIEFFIVKDLEPGVKNIVCQVRLFSQPRRGMYLYPLLRDMNICSKAQTLRDDIISPIVYIVASINLEFSNDTAN